jgi:hypothetical protein
VNLSFGTDSLQSYLVDPRSRRRHGQQAGRRSVRSHGRGCRRRRHEPAHGYDGRVVLESWTDARRHREAGPRRAWDRHRLESGAGKHGRRDASGRPNRRRLFQGRGDVAGGRDRHGCRGPHTAGESHADPECAQGDARCNGERGAGRTEVAVEVGGDVLRPRLPKSSSPASARWFGAAPVKTTLPVLAAGGISLRRRRLRRLPAPEAPRGMHRDGAGHGLPARGGRTAARRTGEPAGCGHPTGSYPCAPRFSRPAWEFVALTAS